MGWLRLHAEMATDPKFRVIAARTGETPAAVIATFTAMLCFTQSRPADQRGTLAGWSDDLAAETLGIEAERIARIRAAMQGLVLAGEVVAGWNRRQFRGDVSTPRVQRHRAARRAAREAIAQSGMKSGNRTPRFTPVSPRFTPTESSGINGVSGLEKPETVGNAGETPQNQNQNPLNPLSRPQPADLLAEAAKRARARLAERARTRTH